MSTRTRAIARVTLMSVGAAALYGGWAIYANWAHGLEIAGRAGITQAAFSATTTAAMSSLMEALFDRHRHRPVWTRLVLSAGVPSVIGVALLLAVHALVGTPELFLTILPSACIGSVYSLVYSANLVRADEK